MNTFTLGVVDGMEKIALSPKTIGLAHARRMKTLVDEATFQRWANNSNRGGRYLRVFEGQGPRYQRAVPGFGDRAKDVSDVMQNHVPR